MRHQISRVRGNTLRGTLLMLRDNEVLKKMIATGEERMSKLASQLRQNGILMGALQKTVSAALEAKATAERAAQTALGAMNIPTSGDVKKLEGKIAELQQKKETGTNGDTPHPPTH